MAEIKTPAEWETLTGVRIYDPDGWRGRMAQSYDVPITLAEFEKRAMMSTCLAWPKNGILSPTGEAPPRSETQCP